MTFEEAWGGAWRRGPKHQADILLLCVNDSILNTFSFWAADMLLEPAHAKDFMDARSIPSPE